MNIRTLAVPCMLLVVLSFALVACQKQDEGPAQHAGKVVDKAVEQVGEKIEKAGEKIQDSAKGNKK